MTEVFHTKYRPDNFGDVIGQDVAVEALKAVLDGETSHAFLFCGQSGCGKTTLARITAAYIGCRQSDIIEIDGATNSGVDKMRSVAQTLQYKPLGSGKVRAVIVDECHRISNAAFESLLKAIEEPPAHAYWFFCTTRLDRVPKTIKNRCTKFEVKAPNEDQIAELIDKVTEAEDITLNDKVRRLIITKADSFRQALVNLALCCHVTTRREAAEILRAAIETSATIELCRFLLAGGSWKKCMSIVERLEGEEAESVRIVVMNYMAKTLIKASSDKRACSLLRIMDEFSVPYNHSEKMAPLLISIGSVLFEGE